MSLHATVLDELEGVLSGGSAVHRAHMLLKMADLFVDSGANYSDEQLCLFDDIFCRLTREIEYTAKVELSRRICDAAKLPPRLLRQLVFDDAIDVAAPILTHSDRLDDKLLIECVHTQGQDHLLAISRRIAVSEAVTDELVTRGNSLVLQTIVDNSGSRFSDRGYSKLVQRARGSDILAVGIGKRADLPRHHFLRLLAAASCAVREQLEAANPQNAVDIRSIVSQVAVTIATQTVRDHDYEDAIAQVHVLKSANALGDLELLKYITEQNFEFVVAALAVLAGLDVIEVEKALLQERPEGLLLIVKAVGLGWPTAKALLLLRAGKRGLSQKEIEQALSDFSRLRADTAQQVLLLKQQRAN